MKIALVAQHATPLSSGNMSDGSGQASESRLRELSRSLASNGHRVTVYAQRHASTLPERAELEPGVAVEYIGPADDHAAEADLLKQVPAFSRPLRERWRAERPDVVHAVRWTSGLAALAAARDLRIPVVQTFDSLGVAERRHHLIPRDAGTERIRLEPAIGRSASAVMAGSSDEQTDLARLGVPRRHIRVVPCGVETDEFTPEGPVAERGTRPRLVTIADLSEHDALANLLHALSKVPGADLVVAGGPPREELRSDLNFRLRAKLADTLGVSGQVTFASTRSAAPRCRRCCAPPTCLSTSATTTRPASRPSGRWRAAPRSSPAAYAGQADAVLDGTTGIVVPPGRPALLAQRIRQLIGHPMMLEAFSVAAVDRAQSRYSWDRIAAETIAVYDTARDIAAMAA